MMLVVEEGERTEMGGEPELPADWTEPERWVWQRIAAGELADLNARDRQEDPECKDLDPSKAADWADNRRLHAKFLRTILTQKAFVDATPYSGVQILGALVDDAPLDLDRARLQRLFWLEKSRILVDVNGRNVLVDNEFSLDGSFVAGDVTLFAAEFRERLHLSAGQFQGRIDLNSATVTGSAYLGGGATFTGDLNLRSVTIGTNLEMVGSTFEGSVNLNGATVTGNAFLKDRATFKGEMNLAGATIGANLEMSGSMFEGFVNLNRTTVTGSAFLDNGATFKGELNLVSAIIGSVLVMDGSTFEGSVIMWDTTVTASAFLRDGATFKDELNLGNATIGTNLMMDGSTFEGSVNLERTTVTGSAFLRDGATFKGELNLMGATIGSVLVMGGSTFEGPVIMWDTTVAGSALLNNGATFKGKLNLEGATLGSVLVMDGSTFEGPVIMWDTTVTSSAYLRGGATFKDELILGSVTIGTNLVMDGSMFEGLVNLNGATVTGGAFLRDGATFKGELNLVGATIGANLEMGGSTFERFVNIWGAKVNGAALLGSGATFKGALDLVNTWIGSDLDFSGAKFFHRVNLTGAKVDGELRLGSSHRPAARWEEGAELVLRNAHVAALQDWWQSDASNSWPNILELVGFTYERLGGLYGEGEEANMLARPVAWYTVWLGRDPTFSPQPYEFLARLFREAGEPEKANYILYAARERRRRIASSSVDDHGQPKERNWKRWVAMSLLKWTIGYGLGSRYFRVLWWVGGMTLLGALSLIVVGSHPLGNLPRLVVASLDQLLPIITLDKVHDTLIFGDASATPPVDPQPYGLLVYFYAHKIAGWVLASFLVAGLSGLTQRN